jgi:hypothetical protein
MRAKALTIGYVDRKDFAYKIVQLAPEGYTGYRLGVRLSKTMQVVEYDTAGLKGYESVERLAKQLGLWDAPPYLKYQPPAAAIQAAAEGKRGVVILDKPKPERDVAEIRWEAKLREVEGKIEKVVPKWQYEGRI